MATARTMDLRPLRRNDHDRAGMIWEAKPGTANENGCQQDVPPYAAQGAPKVNFNVGEKEKYETTVHYNDECRDGLECFACR